MAAKNTHIVELRKYDDPLIPNSQYIVELPVTSTDAVFDADMVSVTDALAKIGGDIALLRSEWEAYKNKPEEPDVPEKPETITVKDMISWSSPSSSGGYASADGALQTWGFNGKSASEKTSSDAYHGYRMYDYTHIPDPVYTIGYVTWAVNMVAGRKYYISAVGGAGNTAVLKGSGFSQLTWKNSNFNHTQIITASNNASSVTFTCSGAGESSYLNSLDIVDVTDLLKYVDETTAKNLCNAKCRGASGGAQITLTLP